MARRRVNVKFLGIALMVVVGAAGAVYAAKTFLFKDNPKRFIELGNKYFHEHNWELAHRNYQDAIRLDPKNTDVLVKDGDTLREMARKDAIWAGQDLAQWERARTVDPTCVPALERLLTQRIELVENLPRPDTFKALKNTAESLLAAKPDHLKAEAYFHIGTIASYISGTGEDENRVEASLAAMTELMKKDPTNPDVPFYLARVHIYRAQDLMRQSRTKKTDKSKDKFAEDADKLVAQGVAVFDKAIQADPNNPVMHYRYYQTLAFANQLALVEEDTTKPDEDSNIERMRREMKLARELAKPEENSFVEIYIAAARFEARYRRNAEAVQILRDLKKQVPDDQRARLALAEELKKNPKTRDEAIAILREPVSAEGGGNAFGGAQTRVNFELQTYLDLDNILIEQAAGTPEGPKKQDMLKEVRENFQRLKDKAGDRPAVVKLKGKIELLEGGTEGAIKAIQTFEKCQRMLQLENAAIKDFDLYYLLARAYYASRQTGQAKSFLWKIVDGVPTFAPARILLAKLLIADHEMELAGDQLNALQQLVPNEPDFINLRIEYYATLDVKKDPKQLEELQKLYAAMPETSAGERRSKAVLAQKLGQTALAAGLLEKVRAEQPDDVLALRQLAQLYGELKQPEKAQAAVKAALDKNPQNTELQLMDAQLRNAAPEEINKIAVAALNKIPDPVTRELKLFELASAQGKQDEALKHLEEAEKANPNETRVWDVRFQLALARGKWDEAETYSRKLGEKNVDEVGGLIYQFRLAMAKNDVAKATSVAEQMTKSAGEFSRSWFFLGQAKQAAGLFDQAISNYTVALEKQSENLDAYRGIIDCYYRLNQPEAAHRYIQKAVAGQPSNPWVNEQEVLWQLNFGDPNQAVAPRLKQRDANPKALDRWVALGQAYFRVAQAEVQRGHVEQYQAAIKNCRDTYLEAVKAWPKEKVLYASLADLAVFTRDFEGGLKAMQAMLAVPEYKDLPEMSLALADYYSRFGKTAEAEAAMKDALARGKNAPELQSRLAAFYVQQNQPAKALAVLDAASPDRRIQLQIVETQIAARQYDKAQEGIKKQLAGAIAGDPQFTALLGFVYFAQNHPDQALPLFDEALRLDPKNTTALYYRGILRLKSGTPDPDRALVDLTAARDINPRNVDARLAIAEALRQKGQFDEAMRELENTLRQAPTSREARLKLLELYAQGRAPRWSDAERVLTEAQAMFPQDPDWPRVAASMWTLRNPPNYGKAEEQILLAMKLAPDNPLLLQEYMNILLKSNKFRDLLAVCDQLIATNPKAATAPWVYVMRAIAKSKTNHKEEGILDFDNAIRIATETKNEDALTEIAQKMSDTIGQDDVLRRIEKRVQADNRWRVIAAYLRSTPPKSDFVGAIELIEKVFSEKAKLSPAEWQTAQAVGGAIYMQANEPEKALACYREVLKGSPEDLASLNNMACILSDLISPPRPTEALECAKRAYDVMQRRGGPDTNLLINVLDTYGWMLHSNNKTDEGIPVLQQAVLLAVDRNVPLVDAHYHMAVCYLKKSNPHAALAQLTQAKDAIKRRQAAKDGAPVDPKLEQKVEAATSEAQQMVQQMAARDPQGNAGGDGTGNSAAPKGNP